MKYCFIEENKSSFGVALLCSVLQVSRSAYYHWKKKGLSFRDLWRLELISKILQVYESSKKAYGAPRVYHQLIKDGVKTSLNTVASIMSKHGLVAAKRRRFKVTTNSDHSLNISPNLLEQNFKTGSPNEAWVSDITYIETKEGWLYLATTIDLYSRKLVGWSMDSRMTKELVLKALRMALDSRDIKKGLIHHSDRASQYASNAFQQTLRSNGILSSMSRKGNCWDNAVAESFFSTIKTECCFQHGVFENREVAKTNIFEYIEGFYNQKRIHSYLGYIAPDKFEAI